MARFPTDVRRLLADLIACPSVTAEGDAGGTVHGEARMGAKLAELLGQLGADVENHPLAPGRPNVLGIFEPRGRAEATVLLAPHLDTVGVAGMSVPPFRLTARGPRLHGRGTCDTKGPTAALLWALRQWTRSPAARRSRIRWIFAATSGEETGSEGAQYLVDQKIFGPAGGSGKAPRHAIDFAVALEPTDLRVVYATKGILRVWVETRGRAAHGAKPELGVNAVYKMLPLARWLAEGVAPELARQTHPVLGGASLNLGLIAGGQGMNLVPDKCRIGLDIRTHPDCDGAHALRRVRAAVRSTAPGAEVSVLREAPSFVTPQDGPWIAELRRCARGWATADWFCDANIFAGAGIPAAAFGPGNIGQAHTHDEYLLTKELERGVAAFRRFLDSPR